MFVPHTDRVPQEPIRFGDNRSAVKKLLNARPAADYPARLAPA
jgi:hypothetical protein